MTTTPALKGSRLSPATKAAIAAAKKSGKITGAQAQKLRTQFRSKNVAEQSALMRKAGIKKPATYAQLRRTQRRITAKNAK